VFTFIVIDLQVMIVCYPACGSVFLDFMGFFHTHIPVG